MTTLLERLAFVDDEHLKGELTDSEFEAKAGADFEGMRAKAIKGGHDASFYGLCGEVIVFEKRFRWHHIVFVLFVTRHYAMKPWTRGFKIDWSYRTSNQNGKTARLIPAQSLKPFYEMMARIPYQYGGDSEWLDLDASHAGMEHWTLKQQVQWILEEAEKDIDKVPGVIKKANAMFAKDMETLKALAEVVAA